MRREVISTRISADDKKRLELVNEFYKEKYELAAKEENIEGLFEWTTANTIAMLIRERYKELANESRIVSIEE